jgi:hypothetical protein
VRTPAALLISTLTLIVVASAPAQAQYFRVGLAARFWSGDWYHQPWGYPYPYRPYPPGWRYAESVAVRLDIEPRAAEVFVNGYLAGNVDDFDGIFQRLRLRPGEHEITIYLDGYRTIHERRYFNPNATLTIRRTMAPLGPGETQEPLPVPVEPPAATGRTVPERRPEPPSRPRPERLGTLSLHVEPADAEVVVDGERRAFDAGRTLLSLQLPPGRHTVEVRREGYQTYTEDMLIRPDATLSVTVALRKR